MVNKIQRILSMESKTYSALEYIAKEATKDADFTIRTVISGVALAFDRAPTKIYNAMSVISKQEAKVLFDELVALAKKSKLKTMGDVQDYLFDKFSK
jgi:hypothetical protein